LMAKHAKCSSPAPRGQDSDRTSARRLVPTLAVAPCHGSRRCGQPLAPSDRVPRTEALFVVGEVAADESGGEATAPATGHDRRRRGLWQPGPRGGALALAQPPTAARGGGRGDPSISWAVTVGRARMGGAGREGGRGFAFGSCWGKGAVGVEELGKRGGEAAHPPAGRGPVAGPHLTIRRP